MWSLKVKGYQGNSINIKVELLSPLQYSSWWGVITSTQLFVSNLLFIMRISYCLLLGSSVVAGVPIPSSYTWSFTSWSSGWYGIGWANFKVSAPQTTISGVTIPALSLTGICHIANKGGETQNCNDLIAGDQVGRSLEFTLRPFDISLQEVQLDAVYKFTEGDR